jgi:hypothetical protein
LKNKRYRTGARELLLTLLIIRVRRQPKRIRTDKTNPKGKLMKMMKKKRTHWTMSNTMMTTTKKRKNRSQKPVARIMHAEVVRPRPKYVMMDCDKSMGGVE